MSAAVAMHTDRDVVRSARGAITQLHRAGIAYAYPLFSPLHDEGILDALRRLTIKCVAAQLGDDEVEAVVPPVNGRYYLVYSSDVDAERRRLALRHGMGHVVAGHVTEIAFLRSGRGWEQFEERVADLFALADLVPAPLLVQMAEHRKGRARWTMVFGDVCKVVRRLTVTWPEPRVLDRAALRVALYREEGL